MLADIEHTINSIPEACLQSAFSMPGQKFSKHTLPLAKDVTSPASQQIPQNKGHYSSQRSTVLSTQLIMARSRILPTHSLLPRGLFVTHTVYRQTLAAPLVSLQFSCMITKKVIYF